MRTESYDEFLQEQLRDPELAAEYLTVAAEEGSAELFLIALRNVTEAQGGIAEIAAATHLNRQTMYRTLSSEGNPTLSTLLSILRAVGLNLSFKPATST
ncbi:MAG: putative addiction module antidote protein [Caldilineales bacterium]|nr:putative addiction module antidote protein [Caldilineales bacterium]MCW5858566.1 putative addiction module antidote protein [Caldilineales bacterium]